MPANKHKLHIKNVAIEGATSVEGDFHYYRGIIQSKSLNKRHFFRASDKTLRSIQEQADAGTHIYNAHSMYGGKPLGKSVSATFYDGKVRSTFYILANVDDVDSNSHIKRLDAGIVDELSTSFYLTDESYITCDACADGTRFEQRHTWFSSYFECENNHILGGKYKQDGKENRVTGELNGPVSLIEYSLVPTGADPGAEITKKVKESMQNGLFDNDTLLFIAECENFEPKSFLNSLELDIDNNGTIFDLGRNPMPPNTNPELLVKENERLEGELESMTEERDNLKAENETLKENAGEHTDEDFVTLEEEKTELETTLANTNKELETAKSKVSKIEGLENTLRENYQALYLSLYYDGVETEGSKQEVQSQMKDLDVLELYNSVTSMRRSLAKKRAKGRQSSSDEDYSKSKSRRIPAHVNELGL